MKLHNKSPVCKVPKEFCIWANNNNNKHTIILNRAHVWTKKKHTHKQQGCLKSLKALVSAKDSLYIYPLLCHPYSIYNHSSYVHMYHLSYPKFTYLTRICVFLHIPLHTVFYISIHPSIHPSVHSFIQSITKPRSCFSLPSRKGRSVSLPCRVKLIARSDKKGEWVNKIAKKQIPS